MSNVFIKGLFFGIVGMLLIFALIAVCIFGGGYASWGKAQEAVVVPVDDTAISLFESGGYMSAELAIRAYLDGYKAMDIEKMITTFAIETFVDRFNFKAQVGNDSEYSTTLNSNLAYPNKSRLLRLDNIYQRLAQAERWISEQLIGYTEPDFGGITADDMETMELEPLYDMIYNVFPDDDAFAPIESLSVERFLSPDEMGTAASYSAGDVSNYISMAKETYGIDELSDVAAVCSIGGQEYYLTFIAFRYDDRWFVGEVGGTPGLSITNAEQITNGIFKQNAR